MKKIFLALISALAIIYTGCYYDKADQVYPVDGNDCDTGTVRLSVEINDILTANCLVCHGGNAATGGGFQLENYNVIKSLALDGTLLSAITHTGSASPMPKGGNKLPECDINKFRAWINRGAQNN